MGVECLPLKKQIVFKDGCNELLVEEFLKLRERKREVRYQKDYTKAAGPTKL